MSTIIIHSKNFQSFAHELDQIRQIDQCEFPFPWSKLTWSQFLSENDFLCSASKENGIVVSFCLFKLGVIESVAHLLKIASLEEFRGRGHGRVCHDCAEEYIRLRPFSSLYLEVSTNNFNAIALYKNVGYKTLIKKKKFYSNGDDAYAMQKELN